MSYYRQLADLAQEIGLWADLRHEQGVDIKPTIEKLTRRLAKARKKLQKTGPNDAILAREPNGLDEIRALRPNGPRVMAGAFDWQGFRSRLKGAWLARAAGCTLGAPVENWSVADTEALARRSRAAFPPTDYWPQHPTPDLLRYEKSLMRDYLKGAISEVPVDDDITYTILGLLIFEEHGPGFTTKQVGEAWLKYLPVACTAEAVALDNLRAGVPTSKVGEKNNPFQEWIGADIRSDPWGYLAPGRPEQAAAMAYQDAYLSHRQNGIYGEMYFSAVIAAAFAVDSPLGALEIGLTEIPAECRLARDVRWAIEAAPKLKDWREARDAVDARFPGMSTVHTNNNACLTIFGLLLGKMDMTKTLGITVAMGLDNDCTAATAGSILGAIIGLEGVPSHWWKPFRNRTRTYLNGLEWFKNTDLITRFAAGAKKVWQEDAKKESAKS